MTGAIIIGLVTAILLGISSVRDTKRGIEELEKRRETLKREWREELSKLTDEELLSRKLQETKEQRNETIIP